MRAILAGMTLALAGVHGAAIGQVTVPCSHWVPSNPNCLVYGVGECFDGTFSRSSLSVDWSLEPIPEPRNR